MEAATPRPLRAGHLGQLRLCQAPDGSAVVRKRVACRTFLDNHRYALTRLAGTGVVPDLRGVTPEVLEVEYAFVDGQHLEEVGAGDRGACLAAAGAALALLHAHHLDGYGPLDGPRDATSDWWEIQDRNVGDWLRAGEADGLLTRAVAAQVRQRYRFARAAVGEERASGFAHGDYRPDNLLFVRAEGGWRCRVLDFDHSQAAPPHLDFGRIELDLFEGRPEARGAFLGGYRAVAPLPALAAVLPLYRIIWPLNHVVWGARAGAADLVAENRRRLERLCRERG
jgi:Ser/Thr protein kinase RdoA (MazF antagonist)